MKQSTIEMLKEQQSEWDTQNQVLATLDEIQSYEEKNEKIHPSYIPYLKEIGYLTIGSEYFDRIKELKENFKKGDTYKKTGKMKESFIFHWDGCGNPVGISWKDSSVYVDDDVFGEGMRLSHSIDEYIIKLIEEE